MSSELHAKILGFLAGEFNRKEGKACVQVDVLYAMQGYRDEELRSWERADEPDLFDNLALVEQLVSSIIDICENHADSFGTGSHRYVLRTRQHLGGRATYSFKLAQSYSSGTDDAALMAPGGRPSSSDAMGVVTQNNLALMRTNTQMFQASFGTLASLAENLREENIKLKADNAMMQRELDEAKSTKLEREFKIHMEAEKNIRTGKSFDKLMQIGTVVTSKMMGGGNEPGAPTALSMLVTELGSSLRPEQLAPLFNVLDMGQRILFAEIMKHVTVTAEQPQGQQANGAHP